MSKDRKRGRSRAGFLAGGVTPRTYSVGEVADILNVKPRVLLTWVRTGCVPQPVGEGEAALFTADQIDNMLGGLSFPGTYCDPAPSAVKVAADQLRTRGQLLNGGPARCRNTRRKGGVK